MTAMKKRTALLMCICLSFALLLTGCGGGDKDALVGEWESAVDMTDMLNDMFTSDPSTSEMAEYLKVDSYVLNLTFTFNSDGTYKIAIDRDALQQTSEALLNTMKDGMTRYLEDAIEESGLDVTVEDLLDGTDLDSMFNMDELLSAFDAVESEGTYEAKDGKLYLTNKADDSVDLETYEMISDTEMKLINDTEDTSGLGDITLIKK